jgi:hypothetical protein
MISRISNIIVTNSTNVTLNSTGKPKAVPPLNSLVMVRIIEKTNGMYKILVNGSLFQTKIPFKLNIGDQLLAKVINHSPFTISMDSFLQSKNIDQNLISVLLARLDLKETENSKLVLKALLNNKKILLKRKINRFLEFIEEADGILDDLQLGLLINMIWSENEETSSFLLDSFNSVFDVSFEELCKAILTTIENLNTNKRSHIINEVLNLFVFDPAALNTKQSILPVRDKSRPFMEMMDKVNMDNLDFFSTFELKRLKSLMLKYILQKSLFHRYNTYPEFVIVKDGEVLTLTLIRYERLFNNNGEMLFKTSFGMHKNGIGDFIINYYLSVDKLTGEISVDYENLRLGESFIEFLNEEISKTLGVVSNLRIVLSEIFKNIHPEVEEKLNSINAIA